MKKLLFSGLLFMAVMVINSCDYDDSQDIDILVPKERPQTKTSTANKPASKF